MIIEHRVFSINEIIKLDRIAEAVDPFLIRNQRTMKNVIDSFESQTLHHWNSDNEFIHIKNPADEPLLEPKIQNSLPLAI